MDFFPDEDLIAGNCKLDFKTLRKIQKMDTFKIRVILKKYREDDFNFSKSIDEEDHGELEEVCEIVNGETIYFKSGKVEDKKIVYCYIDTGDAIKYLYYIGKKIDNTKLEDFKNILLSLKILQVEDDDKNHQLSKVMKYNDLQFKVSEEWHYREDFGFIKYTAKDGFHDVFINIDQGENIEFLNSEEAIIEENELKSIDFIKEINGAKSYNGYGSYGVYMAFIAAKKNINNVDYGITILMKNTKFDIEKHSYALEMIDSIKAI